MHINSSRTQTHFSFQGGVVGIQILADKLLRPEINKTLLSISLSALLMMKGRHKLLIICAEQGAGRLLEYLLKHLYASCGLKCRAREAAALPSSCTCLLWMCSLTFKEMVPYIWVFVGILPVLSAYQFRRIGIMLYSALTGALLITVHLIQILLSVGLLNNLKDKWRMKPGGELTLSFICLHLYHNQVLVDTSALSAQPVLWSSRQEAEKERKEPPSSPPQSSRQSQLFSRRRFVSANLTKLCSES